MNPVPTRENHEGVKAPLLIYGTAWKKTDTERLVIEAVQAGFRGIDTACQPKHYEEPLVGRALAHLKAAGIDRSALFLQTKFTPVDGQDPARLPYDPTKSLADQVRQSFQVSLTNLQTDYLDSLILHSPLRREADLWQVWRTMEEIKLSGGVRQLGISNCYDPSLLINLHRMAEVKPAVVQNRFYQATGFDREIRAFCLDQNISYQSFWTLTANPEILNSSAIDTLAIRLNKTNAQIWFRFLTQIGISPLTGTTSAIHRQQDLAIFTFTLDQATVTNLLALLNKS